ncbi:MAG: hypothetical protein ACM32O_02465 [Clostridia bacterium]
MQPKRTISISVDLLLLLLLAVALFLYRLPYAGIFAESWDSVDFALALERYDIFDMQPHFPGYPLYILLAKALLPLTADPVLALTWLAAATGSLSLFPFYVIAKEMIVSRLGTWFAVLLFAASPLLALASVQPMSETLGLFAVLTLEAFVIRAVTRSKSNQLGATCIGATLFAALLGVRISYFAVGFVLLLPLLLLYRQRKAMAGFLLELIIIGCVFLAALAAWLLPTAATEGGLGPFLALGTAFTSGHFSDWGGTSLTSGMSGWQLMNIWVADRMLANGLLGIASLSATTRYNLLLACLLIVLLLAGVLSSRLRSLAARPKLTFLLLATVPYLLWMLLGQNSEKARHLLPLLPWLFILIGLGLDTLRDRANRSFSRFKLRYGLLLAVVATVTLAPLSLRQAEVLASHLTPPPALQLVDYVRQHYPAQGTLTYTWEEQRLFQYYAPDYETERLKSADYFVQSVLLQSGTHPYMLLTNAVLDGFGPEYPLRQQVREVARFSADPFLYPTYHTVILYELPAQTIEQMREQK